MQVPILLALKTCWQKKFIHWATIPSVTIDSARWTFQGRLYPPYGTEAVVCQSRAEGLEQLMLLSASGFPFRCPCKVASYVQKHFLQGAGHLSVSAWWRSRKWPSFKRSHSRIMSRQRLLRRHRPPCVCSIPTAHVFSLSPRPTFLCSSAFLVVGRILNAFTWMHTRCSCSILEA